MSITVTQHNKNEWSRMAQDAYKNSVNYIGHRYSGAAAIPNGSTLPEHVFDALQLNYRKWLVGGIEQFRSQDSAIFTNELVDAWVANGDAIRI